MLALEAGRDHWAAEEVLGASQVTVVVEVIGDGERRSKSSSTALD